jgi:hypothetical protein
MFVPFVSFSLKQCLLLMRFISFFRGTIEMDNFIMPFLGHTITLTQHQEDQEQQQQLTLEDATEEASGPTWNLQPLSITKRPSV